MAIGKHQESKQTIKKTESLSKEVSQRQPTPAQVEADQGFWKLGSQQNLTEKTQVVPPPRSVVLGFHSPLFRNCFCVFGKPKKADFEVHSPNPAAESVWRFQCKVEGVTCPSSWFIVVFRWSW